MSTRPTDSPPQWSTSGSNTEPSAGKKAQGWLVNERPPAEWLNWFQNAAGRWLQFLADVTSGSATPDLALNFSNTNPATPALDITVAPSASSYKLVLRTLITPSIHADIWVGTTSRKFVITHNALWNGSAWRCEDTSQVATGLALVQDGAQNVIEALYHAATASTWADSAWARGNALVAALAASSLNVSTLTVTGLSTMAAINASGAVQVSSLTVNAPHLYLDDTADIVHPGPASAQPDRTVVIPLCSGKLHNSIPWATVYDPVNDYIYSTPTDDLVIDFPLEIPRETVEWNVIAMWMAPDSAHANSFTVLKSWREVNMAVSTPLSPANMGTRTQNLFSTSTAHSMQLISPITETVQPYVNNYFVRVFIKANTAGTNRLYALALTFADPGPRNG